MAGAQATSNNSSDFVRKLYKMLEEPEYLEIVRWGDNGDSFVVLEGEKFSSTILPKHFKHSNFASFVRQLNKYDFHKVRRQDDGRPGYGANTWEFRHPDFRIDCKDNLDSIRRKTPASRKPASQDAPSLMASQHQLACLTENACATQKQVQQLQAQFSELAQANQMLVKEVAALQRLVRSQSQAQHHVLHYLEATAQRQGQPVGQSLVGVGGSDDVTELRRARELLSGSGEDESDRSRGIYTSSEDSANSSATMYGPMADLNGRSMINDLDLTKFPVYPVGQTVGIDPFHSDHIHNIPYPIPSTTAVAEHHPRMPPETVRQTAQPHEAFPEWGPKKPYIYLVEDDKICSKIGHKFLISLGCNVERAKDGLEAVSLINQKPPPQFDLIFMDIIMPRLDGVSATACIREHLPQTPIIAMTSNIRQEDVSYYLKYGMNDVLAKPFTKDGMLRMLKKHLPHLLTHPSPHSSDMGGPYTPIATGPAAIGSMGVPAIATTGLPAKFDGTPIQSPATTATASWHSPGPSAPNNASPVASPLETGSYVSVNNSGQLVMGPASSQRPGFMATTMGPPISNRPELDDRPEKRPRILGPQQAYVQ